MISDLTPPVVMAVDDTPANLVALEALLAEENFRVLQFPRGDLALRAAARQRPDIILLDIMMPDMDGFEVCRRLRQEPSLRDVPVIFISALDDVSSKLRAFSEGGVDYVAKPFQKDEVLARVKTHLRLRRQQIELDARRAEAQRSYERLRDLESQRDQLVHMIVHDMRAPLMGIIGFAELLESNSQLAKDPEAAEQVGFVLSSAFRLEAMVTTLLDISRLESNAMPVHTADCNLRQLAEDAVCALSALAREAHIAFEPETSDLAARCDPALTGRIVQNLLANAIKFAPRGTIRIRFSSAPDHHVRIEVADDGPGIPPQFLGRIFEKFGQVENRKAGTHRSSGLGLTFCKLAAEAQGGQIGVQSAEGVGSTFWIALPAAPPPMASADTEMDA